MFPTTLEHNGATFYATGKVGTRRSSGLAVAEYDRRGVRVWLDAAGKVWPE